MSKHGQQHRYSVFQWSPENFSSGLASHRTLESSIPSIVIRDRCRVCSHPRAIHPININRHTPSQQKPSQAPQFTSEYVVKSTNSSERLLTFSGRVPDGPLRRPPCDPPPAARAPASAAAATEKHGQGYSHKGWTGGGGDADQAVKVCVCCDSEYIAVRREKKTFRLGSDQSLCVVVVRCKQAHPLVFRPNARRLARKGWHVQFVPSTSPILSGLCTVVNRAKTPKKPRYL